MGQFFSKAMYARARSSTQQRSFWLSSIALATVLAALPSFAYAQIAPNWTGATSSDWLESSNWSVTTPGSVDSAYITTLPMPTNQPVIASGVSGAADKLYINNGNELTVRDGGVLTISNFISIAQSFVETDPGGTLSILSGGHVTTNGIYVGDGINFGAVLIAGTSSSLTANLSRPDIAQNRFIIGAWGDGELTVADNGALSVSGTGLLELGGTYNGRLATGTLHIGNAGAAGTVSAKEIRFNTSTSSIIANFVDSLTLNAAITGTGSVKKDGIGTLILNGTNIYSGATTIASGTLLAGATNTLSGNSAHTVSSGALLDLANYDQSIGSLAGAGTVDLGSAVLTTGTDNTSTTFSGLIEGSGRLIKVGSGALTLTSTNTYTGGTTISGGTVVAGHHDGGNVIDALGTGLITLNGGRLHSSASSSTLNDYLIVGGTTSTISAATGTTLWLNGGGGQYFTLDGDVVIGASDGAGTVVMDVIGTPTSSDATITVAYGRLVNGNSSLGNITSVAGATRVASGATLDMSTYGGTIRNLQDATPGNGGTVSWASNPLYVYGGSFSGRFDTSQGGNLVKGSTDTLLLNGDNYNFSGTTTVAEGKLIVGDANNSSAALGGAINVLSGATLGGYGSVGETTVQSGGILSPGNSIGILTVDGNLTLQPGSTLEVEIAASGPLNRRSDIVGVTGMATISGSTVAVTAIDSETSYQNGQNYTILHADGGVSGTFANVVSRSAFLNMSAVCDADDVMVTIATKTTTPVDPEVPNPGTPVDPGTSNPGGETPAAPPLFTTVAQTRNQLATAGGLDTLAQTGSSLALYNTLLMLSADEARAAFDSLSGEAYASAKGVLINDGQFIRNAALGRLQQAFGGAPAAPISALSFAPSQKPVSASAGSIDAVAPASIAPAHNLYTAWGYAYGAWNRQDSNGNPGSVKSSVGGFVTGIDGTVLDTWRLGLLAGYSHSSFDVDDRASSGSSDNYTLGAYAGTEWTLNNGHALAFRSGLAYTWHDMDMNRSVAFPGFADNLTSDYDAGSFQVFGEIGYKIHYGKALFEPYAGLAYVRLKTDGFDETGQTAAALSVQSGTTDTSFSTLGLRASTEFVLGSITATARTDLGWRHAYGDITPVSTASFIGSNAFTVSGLPIAEDAALIEAGLDFRLTEDATLGISYNGQFASGAKQNGFNAKLSVSF